MFSSLDCGSISLLIFTTIIGFFIVRLSVCLPAFSSQRPSSARSRRKQKGKDDNDNKTSTIKTMIIWGSGGHTTEMILLQQKLSSKKLSPTHCVLAQTDQTSYDKIQAAKLELLEKAEWHRITRSREVKQTWSSTIWTTLLSLYDSLWLVLKIRPELVICNGPGTCVPICYLVFLMKLLFISSSKIVFVESFCRVQKLSLTGKLLYPIADRFIVQWPQLLSLCGRAEYLGDIEPVTKDESY